MQQTFEGENKANQRKKSHWRGLGVLWGLVGVWGMEVGELEENNIPQNFWPNSPYIEDIGVPPFLVFPFLISRKLSYMVALTQNGRRLC